MQNQARLENYSGCWLQVVDSGCRVKVKMKEQGQVQGRTKSKKLNGRQVLVD